MYPNVNLSQARKRRDEAKKSLAEDNDQNFIKQKNQRAKKQAAKNSLEDITRERHTKFLLKWIKGHAKTIISRQKC